MEFTDQAIWWSKYNARVRYCQEYKYTRFVKHPKGANFSTEKKARASSRMLRQRMKIQRSIIRQQACPIIPAAEQHYQIPSARKEDLAVFQQQPRI